MAEHTPGPWMAAAQPSSIVGLPIVARSSGRSIASVTFFALGEAFKNHDRENEANARLIAAAPDYYAAADSYCEWLKASRDELPENALKAMESAFGTRLQAAHAKATGAE